MIITGGIIESAVGGESSDTEHGPGVGIGGGIEGGTCESPTFGKRLSLVKRGGL